MSPSSVSKRASEGIFEPEYMAILVALTFRNSDKQLWHMLTGNKWLRNLNFHNFHSREAASFDAYRATPTIGWGVSTNFANKIHVEESYYCRKYPFLIWEPLVIRENLPVWSWVVAGEFWWVKGTSRKFPVQLVNVVVSRHFWQCRNISVVEIKDHSVSICQLELLLEIVDSKQLQLRVIHSYNYRLIRFEKITTNNPLVRWTPNRSVSTSHHHIQY